MTAQEKLVAAVTDAVNRHFSGDWNQAFIAKSNGDGMVGFDELVSLLEWAGITPALYRAAVARGILRKVDTDQDRQISFAEFRSVFQITQ